MTTQTIDTTQFETVLRLAEIFTPYAASRLKNLQENNIKLAHYTSAENAMLILKTKQIWLRDTRCMIDYLEVVHGYNRLHEWFSLDSNTQAFLSEFEHFSPGVAKDAINLFNQWWQHIPTSTFIACLSEHTSDDDSYAH